LYVLDIGVLGFGQEGPMAIVEGPNLPESHPDRFLSCKEAMKDRFNELVEAKQPMTDLHAEAIAAGWNENEAREGILGLLEAQVAMEKEMDLEEALRTKARDENNH
jgi:hypothetical protein